MIEKIDGDGPKGSQLNSFVGDFMFIDMPSLESTEKGSRSTEFTAAFLRKDSRGKTIESFPMRCKAIGQVASNVCGCYQSGSAHVVGRLSSDNEGLFLMLEHASDIEPKWSNPSIIIEGNVASEPNVIADDDYPLKSTTLLTNKRVVSPDRDGQKFTDTVVFPVSCVGSKRVGAWKKSCKPDRGVRIVGELSGAGDSVSVIADHFEFLPELLLKEKYQLVSAGNVDMISDFFNPDDLIKGKNSDVMLAAFSRDMAFAMYEICDMGDYSLRFNNETGKFLVRNLNSDEILETDIDGIYGLAVQISEGWHRDETTVRENILCNALDNRLCEFSTYEKFMLEYSPGIPFYVGQREYIGDVISKIDGAVLGCSTLKAAGYERDVLDNPGVIADYLIENLFVREDSERPEPFDKMNLSARNKLVFSLCGFLDKEYEFNDGSIWTAKSGFLAVPSSVSEISKPEYKKFLSDVLGKSGFNPQDKIDKDFVFGISPKNFLSSAKEVLGGYSESEKRAVDDVLMKKRGCANEAALTDILASDLYALRLQASGNRAYQIRPAVEKGRNDISRGER